MKAPTSEQQAIADAYRAGDGLVIEAGAGTGKTSTLRMLAAAVPARRGIYVAYNKAIAAEAQRSFPAGVTCATAHSLAFRAVGRQFARRLNGPRMPARETARILGINEPISIGGGKNLAPEQVARLAGDTVTRYCYSDAAEIGPRHVPIRPGLDDPGDLAVLRQVIPPLADKAWADLTHPDGRLKFSHDHYLKMWQLSGPQLPADYVMLDEAQDANPVVAAIVTAQGHCQQVLVGDRCQAIYGWRGAVDAMSSFAGTRLALSQSFRFGQAIADEANKWLTLLDAPLRLSGYERISSAVGPAMAADAVLCRSNAEAVAQVMAAHDQGRRAAMAGGGDAIRRLAEAAITLKAGAGTGHPELFVFRTWGEVQDYAEQDSAGSDLRTFVRLIDKHGPDVVIHVIDSLVPEERADVVVSTAHKAKGLEWDSVRIATDFKQPANKNGVGSARAAAGKPEMPRETAMLAYVAVTRARLVLDHEGLAWVDDWLNPTTPAGVPR
jgi:hypothetical protein